MIAFDQIDSRLKELGKDRAWLAEETGRKINSIRVALAENADPKNRSELLQKSLSDAIEREEERRKNSNAIQLIPPVLDRVTIDCQPGERRDWNAAASRKELSLDEWIVFSLNAAAKKAAKTTPFPANTTPFPAKADILAAAGPPIFSEVTEWDGSDDTVMVRISGLSMTPLLNDGDVIPMKHKKASRNPFMKKGLIYLVAYDGGYTVKRYNTRPALPEEKGEEWVEKGKVKVLESINPDFPEIIIKQPLEWVAWLG